jgi:vacuolar-type H+-ATPase subunit I/STV1
MSRKVLKKLQIHLKAEEIERIAKAESNCIEEVLLRVMKRVGAIKTSCKNEPSSSDNCEESSSILTIKVWKQIGDHVEEVPQQMIQFSLFEELQGKCERQRELIAELQGKIDDMQDALTWKTQIIDDLKDRLEKKPSQAKRTFSIGSLKDSLSSLL